MSLDTTAFYPGRYALGKTKWSVFEGITAHRPWIGGFPRWLRGKEPNASAGDSGSIPVWVDSPGGGNGNPLQYSCLENPMDRGAWWATVHRVSKRWTWLSTRVQGPGPWIDTNFWDPNIIVIRPGTFGGSDNWGFFSSDPPHCMWVIPKPILWSFLQFQDAEVEWTYSVSGRIAW